MIQVQPTITRFCCRLDLNESPTSRWGYSGNKLLLLLRLDLNESPTPVGVFQDGNH